MNAGAQDDLLSYYERHFRPGMIDLSESSPPAVDLPGTSSPCSLAYQGPDATRALRRAIAGRYETLSEDDIVITNGASEALAAVALSTLEPGRRAFIGEGAYPTFKAIAERVGAVFSDAPRDADVVVLANPTIPAGQLLNVAGQISRSAMSGARIVVDEVYRELVLSGERAAAACDLDRRAISIGDLSKPLGLGGLRIGWVATRDRELLAQVRREVQLLSGGPAAPSVLIAEQAVAWFDALTGPLLEAARLLADRTYGVLRAHGWSFKPAMSGLTVLARPPRPLNQRTVEALRQGGWFLLPSEVFGIDGGYRISLMQPGPLEAALTGLAGHATDEERPQALVVLTKNPACGGAKTRLAVGVGGEAAAAFAHAFVSDTLALARSSSWATIVAVPAPAADEWLRGRAPTATFVEQADGDLGARLSAAMRRALEAAERAVLIGSDTPDLPREFVDLAFDELKNAEIVVGPARDGGFYLLGVKAWHDGLFAELEWSTSTVCERLLANAQQLGLSCATLPEWDDVDDIESLSRLASRLEAGGTAPASTAVLRAWRQEPAHGS